MSDEPERRAWRTDEGWNRLRERIEGAEASPAVVSHRRQWIAAAAAAVLVASALTWRSTRSRENETRTASTAAGERIVIRLSDSSVVTLGPASTVRYVVTARRRDVELDGLADFKVVHDPKRPFVVRAKNAVTTDVGTEFVVRAYAEDSTVQVAVTEGSVSLAAGGAQPIELRSGDVGHVSANGAPTLGSRGDAQKRAAWLDGRLVFDDEPLSVVAEDLSRWFDVDIRVAAASLPHRSVSAVYNKPTLAGVLEALEATLGVRIDRSGRTITISERSR